MIGGAVEIRQVRGRPRSAIALCGDDATVAADPNNARCSHKPDNPLLPDCTALGTQFRAHTATRAAGDSMDRAHLLEQRAVGDGAC